MRWLLAVMMSSLLVVMGTGPAQRLVVEVESSPCVVIATEPGRVIGKVEGGVLIAIWPDGAVLLSAQGSAPSEWMIKGEMDRAELRELLDSIDRIGFFEVKGHYLVPDAGYATISARVGAKEGSLNWHGSLRPDFGGDISTDAEYRSFVQMWRKVRAAIDGVTPVRVEMLEEGKSFRGYDPDHPRSTTWLRSEAWTK